MFEMSGVTLRLLSVVVLFVVVSVLLILDTQLKDRRAKNHEVRMKKLDRRAEMDDRELKLAQEESKQERYKLKTEQARESSIIQQLKREKLAAERGGAAPSAEFTPPPVLERLKANDRDK